MKSSLPSKNRLRTYAFVWLLLAAGLSATLILGWNLFRRAREQDQNRFERQAKQTADTIRDRFEKYELALAGLADFAALRPHFTAAEWGFRVRLLFPEKNYPGLLELGFVEVNTNALAVTNPGETTGRGDRSLRLRHAWVSPPSAFDGINPRFLVDPATAQAAGEALEANAPRYCYRRELATEIAGKPARGFTLFVPFFGPETHTTTLTNAPPGDPGVSRHSSPTNFAGVIFGSIEPNLLFGSLFGMAPREIGFDLFSSEPLSAKTWLNVNGPAPRSLELNFRPYLQKRLPLRFHGQEWILILYTTPLFEIEASRYRPWTVVGAGTSLTLLTAALLFLQTRARSKQEDIAAELRAACDDLQQVQNERERIGRDLHDGAIQSLYGLQLSLGQLERQQQSRDPATAKTLLRNCRSSLDALIAELRTFIVQHVPGDEDPNRLANASAALQQLVHRFQTASRVPIELVLKDSPLTPVTLTQQMHLRQIAQEAISNSLRHSGARHIRVLLLRHDRHLQLRISDDGSGFDYPKRQGGHGLANMQARSVQLGGRLQVESCPGQGTEVMLELPVPDEPSVSAYGKDE